MIVQVHPPHLRRSLSSPFRSYVTVSFILNIKLRVHISLREQTSKPPHLHDPARDKLAIKFLGSDKVFRECTTTRLLVVHLLPLLPEDLGTTTSCYI